MSGKQLSETIYLPVTSESIKITGPFFLVMSGTNTGKELQIPIGVSIIGREEMEIPLGCADKAISRQHAEVMRLPDKVVISDLNSTNGIFLNGEAVKTATLEHGNLILIGRTLLKYIDHRDVEVLKLRDILRMATTDGLTGICNKRCFMERLNEEFSRSLRNDKPLSVVMLDLDCFKQFNDTNGHMAGDAVLTAVAKAIENVLRIEDLIARFGGEEFIIMVPEIDVEGAHVLAERIRKIIEQEEIKYNQETFQITISLGCATYIPGASSLDSPEELVTVADQQLYQAKQSGRNCWR